MNCRRYGNCNPYNKDTYTPINYAHHRSDLDMPSNGRYPYTRQFQPYRKLDYLGKNYITDSKEFINPRSRTHKQDSTGKFYSEPIDEVGISNLDSSIYGNSQNPILRVSPGEKARYLSPETRRMGKYIEDIKLNPEQIMLIRKFFFSTPIKRPNDQAIASRKYVDLLRYGSPEEIETVLTMASKGIYYNNSDLADNEIKYNGQVIDCESLSGVKDGNCLDDITGSIPHAMCAAKYKYLLGKPYGKCGLDTGCPKNKDYANGTMTCIKDFEQAVKYGLLDNQDYIDKVHKPISSNDFIGRSLSQKYQTGETFTAKPYFEDFSSKNIEQPDQFPLNPRPINREVNEVAMDANNEQVQEIECGNIKRIPFQIGQYVEFTPVNRFGTASSFNYWKQKGWSSRYIPENDKYKLEKLINKNLKY